MNHINKYKSVVLSTTKNLTHSELQYKFIERPVSNNMVVEKILAQSLSNLIKYPAKNLSPKTPSLVKNTFHNSLKNLPLNYASKDLFHHDFKRDLKLIQDTGKVLNWDNFLNTMDPVTGNVRLKVNRSYPQKWPIKAVIPDVHGGIETIKHYLNKANFLDPLGNVKKGSRVIFVGDIIGTRITINLDDLSKEGRDAEIKKAWQKSIESLKWTLNQAKLNTANVLLGNYDLAVLSNIDQLIQHHSPFTNTEKIHGYKQFVHAYYKEYIETLGEKSFIDLYKTLKQAVLTGKISASHYEDGILYTHSMVSPAFADILLKRGDIKTSHPQEISKFLNNELKRAVSNNDFSHPMFRPSVFDFNDPVQTVITVQHNGSDDINGSKQMLYKNHTYAKYLVNLPKLVDIGGPLAASSGELNTQSIWNKIKSQSNLPKLDFIQVGGHHLTSNFLGHFKMSSQPVENARISGYDNGKIKLIGVEVGLGFPEKFTPPRYLSGSTVFKTEGRGKGLLFLETDNTKSDLGNLYG